MSIRETYLSFLFGDEKATSLSFIHRGKWIALVVASWLINPVEVAGQVTSAPNSDQSIVQKLKPPVRFSGGLSMSGTAYTASGIAGRRSPFSYSLNGNATLSVGNFTVPITASVTEQSRDFAVSFRRYGVSPDWGWGRVHLGYRALNFSQYTVAGATFFGGGLELDPGLLRVGVLYGRFQKSRAADDSLGLRPQFKRIGYGARIGIGTDQNYFDIIAFRAKDDTLSLESRPSELPIRPQENAVLGISTSISPIRELSLFGEVSISALNRDITEAVADTSEIPAFLVNLFTPRESVQANLAARAGIAVNTARVGVTAEYQRIDPDYQSLGAYYFNTDLESFTVTPRFSLVNGRINVSLMGGVASNNLYGDLLETTRRIVSSVSISVQTGSAFSINGQYGNFSTDQRAGLREIIDSTRVETISSNVSISPRLRFTSETKSHSVSVRFAQQQFRQVSEITLVSSDAESRTIAANYALRFRLTDLGFRVSVTQLNSVVGIRETVSRGLTLGANKSIFNEAVSAELRFGYRTRKVGEREAAGTLTGDLTLSYSASAFDSFSLRTNYGGRLVDPVESKRANELLMTLTYSRRF